MERISFDWPTLERLRSKFLNPDGIEGSYWKSKEDLEQYHISFGKRISWKWSALWEELKNLGWQPEGKTLLDWGCGSGIATLSFLEAFGADGLESIILWDHSTLACQFAQQHIGELHPHLAVEVRSIESTDPKLADTICLASHVLNELSNDERETLSSTFGLARQIIWVEPGDYESSHLLGVQRERLAERMRIVAPCVCQESCPMFLEDNARHWCHFFARSPIEAFTDPDWARFATMLEIDLRSLPYSYLVLNSKDCKVIGAEPTYSRVIGKPRQYKGYTKALSCDSQGLRDLELQKRDDGKLWKTMKKGRNGSLYKWNELNNGRIKQGESVF